jgi:anti-sigma B factor antagonist
MHCVSEGCELATVFAWQLFRRVLDLLDSPPNHGRNPVKTTSPVQSRIRNSRGCQITFRNNYLRTLHSPVTAQGRLISQRKIMSRMSTCALWEEQRLSSQDKDPKLRLSLETRVTDDLTVICCKGRIAYGIEASALLGEIAELAPQTRRVVIDLSSVEMIDAAGLGALISVALTAQVSQSTVKLAAPGNFIRQLLELTKLTSVFEVYTTLDAATVASRGQAA